MSKEQDKWREVYRKLHQTSGYNLPDANNKDTFVSVDKKKLVYLLEDTHDALEWITEHEFWEQLKEGSCALSLMKICKELLNTISNE